MSPSVVSAIGPPVLLEGKTWREVRRPSRTSRAADIAILAFLALPQPARSVLTTMPV